MNRLLFFAALTLLLSAGAQDAIEVKKGPTVNPWTSLEVNADPDQFQFVIVTDRTGGHRDGIFEDGVRKINLLQPEFVMSVGDLIEGYTEDQTEIDLQWNEFMGFVNALEMPFFFVPGNHDASNMTMVEDWKKRFGKLYYHFVYKDVLFLCLDSEDPPASRMSDEQVAYMKKALEENPDVRWTLVFLHKPLWTHDKPTGWEKFEPLLKGRPHSVFAGHTHNYQKYTRNDSEYIVLATMGGGTQLRGPNFGEFDHFMWVTMTDKGPRFANLLLDGIWDANVLTDERIEIMRPVMSGSAVTTDGIVVDSGTFEKAQTVLRLTNDADVPMQVSLSIQETNQVACSVDRIFDSIPPNSVKTVPVELTARTPVLPLALAPLVVSWNLVFAPGQDVQPIRLRGQHRIVVDTEYALAPAPRNAEVDGDLTEWGTLTIPAEPGSMTTDVDSWNGPRDGAARFSAAYGPKYLYIAAQAQDDEIELDERRGFRSNDSLEIYIDSRPAAARAAGKPGVDFIHVAAIAGQDPASADTRAKLPALPDGAILKSSINDEGFAVELAVPLAVVEAAGGTDWTSVRINVVMNDLDINRVNDDDDAAVVAWRPLWGSPADYANSGVFRKP